MKGSSSLGGASWSIQSLFEIRKEAFPVHFSSFSFGDQESIFVASFFATVDKDGGYIERVFSQWI
jgi:hypothetical protein